MSVDGRRDGFLLVLPRHDQRIEGMILNPDGEPLDGAQVEVLPDNTARDWVPEVGHVPCISAPDGRFVRAGLAKGTYVVRAMDPRFQPIQERGVVTGTTGLRLRFRSGPPSAGEARDALLSP